MQVLVRYCDDLRDVVSTHAEHIELDEGATLQDLKTRLACKHQQLASRLSTLTFSVKDGNPEDTYRLREGDTIELVPSGEKG